MTESVFSGSFCFGDFINRDEIEMILNFEIQYKKNSYLGAYIVKPSMEDFDERVEFYNNDMNTVFASMSDKKKSNFYSKVYSYLDRYHPDSYARLDELRSAYIKYEKEKREAEVSNEASDEVQEAS